MFKYGIKQWEKLKQLYNMSIYWMNSLNNPVFIRESKMSFGK